MAFRPGTKYGSLIYGANSSSPMSPMGMTGQAVDVMGFFEPPDPREFAQANLYYAQADAAREAQALQKRKFDMFNDMLGKFNRGAGFGSGNASSRPMNSLPAPRYINAGPVWSQGQIDAQSNLQRGNLLTQANNQSRDFMNTMATRGFSPSSPFGLLNSQSNLMRANAGAAANETNLNFNAAKANSDARLDASRTNAGMYGDYIRSLAQQQQANANYNLQSQGQQFDIFRTLLQGFA